MVKRLSAGVRHYIDVAFADYSRGFWNAIGMGVAGGIVASVFAAVHRLIPWWVTGH